MLNMLLIQKGQGLLRVTGSPRCRPIGRFSSKIEIFFFSFLASFLFPFSIYFI